MEGNEKDCKKWLQYTRIIKKIGEKIEQKKSTKGKDIQ